MALDRRAALITTLGVILFAILPSPTYVAVAEESSAAPILHARCTSQKTARSDAEAFCRKHQSTTIAACTNSLSDAVWRRCSSWLDGGKDGSVSLPVEFESDPEETCALNVIVDGVDHCVFTQEEAAALLPRGIFSRSTSQCRGLNLDDTQCAQLRSRMLNVSTQELLKRNARRAEQSSVGNADGTRPFMTPPGDMFKMGVLRNLQNKFFSEQTMNRCLSVNTIHKGKPRAVPTVDDTRDGTALDGNGMFSGTDVLRFSQFHIDIDMHPFSACTPGTIKYAMFCVSVARHLDITSSSAPLDFGCLSSTRHRRFLLGNLPFGPHLLHIHVYNTTETEAHPTMVASASSRINVVAKLRPVRTSCPRCATAQQRQHSPPPPMAAVEDTADVKSSLTLLVLVNRGRKALSFSLSSWKRAGLLDFVSERVAFVQKFDHGTPGDKRVALLREYGFKVVGRPTQQGIAQGLSLGVRASSSASILFLEEDFAVPHSITPQDIRRNMRQALGLLRGRVAEVVRLRSTRFPGTPHCANVWRERNRARELLGRASTSWVNNISTLCAGSVVRSAANRPEEGLWDCGNVNGDAICAFSTHASWTNNPIVFRRTFFLRNVAPIAAIDSTRTLEAAMSFTPAAWGCRCHTVAQLVPGCFRHDDLDKPQWQQTVCPEVHHTTV